MDESHVISIKARNKYQKDCSLNCFYKLGSKVYANAKAAEIIHGAQAYWMAIQFDDQYYSIYFGSLQELNNGKSIPIKLCEKGQVGECLVKNRRHYFDFTFFSNKKGLHVT